MKHKGKILLLGYALLTFGLTAIVLQMIGISWAFLRFLDWGGRLFAFVAKILMSMAGVVVIVLAHTDWEREKRESGGDE